MPSTRSFYDILEIPSFATVDDIRRAYRRHVKQVHPDTSVSDDATGLFQELQRAYETLCDSRARAAYDAQLAAERKQQEPGAFTLNVRASHSRLPQTAEPQMLYVIAEIAHCARFQTQRPVVNLCLVLDHSLSMVGARLLRAQEAATFLIDQLAPSDILSVVAFSDRARTVFTGPSGTNRDTAKEYLRTIQPWGATELLRGVQAGIAELRRWRMPGTLDHLILLTDGQTYGDESGCIEAAREAGQDKLGLTLVGLGADWNEQLLDEMAARSGGYATFIDSPARLLSLFRERFKELSDVVARALQLTLHTNEAAQVQNVFRLTPDIARAQLDGGTLLLGDLEAGRPIRVLCELLVSAPQAGALRVLRLGLSGELLRVAGDTHAESDAEVAIEVSEPMSVVEAPPQEIVDMLARIAAYKIQEKVIVDLAEGKPAQATARLKNLATHLMNFGESELARAALLEAKTLTLTGHLSDEGGKRIRYGTRALSGTAILGAQKR
jgi:Ca-activated chloride channel family protein